MLNYSVAELRIIKKERIFLCYQIHIPSSLEVIKKKAYQI